MNEKTRNDILLWISGELDAEGAGRIERLVAADADARTLADLLRGEIGRLDALTDEPVPDALRDRITRAAARGKARRTWRRVALIAGAVAAAAVVVLAVTFAMRTSVPTTPTESPIVQDEPAGIDPMQLALAELATLQGEIDEAFRALENEALDPAGTPLDEDLEDVSASLDDLAVELGLPPGP